MIKRLIMLSKLKNVQNANKRSQLQNGKNIWNLSLWIHNGVRKNKKEKKEQNFRVLQMEMKSHKISEDSHKKDQIFTMLENRARSLLEVKEELGHNLDQYGTDKLKE